MCKTLGVYIPPSQDLPECGKTGNSIDELLDVWDAVNKTVLVEAEGTEVERAINFLICPDDAEGGSFLKEVALEFPFNTVPGTGSCKVQVTAMMRLRSHLRFLVHGVVSFNNVSPNCGDFSALLIILCMYWCQCCSTLLKKKCSWPGTDKSGIPPSHAHRLWEQNMIGFTPNIFVLMYLVHTNQRVNFPEVYNQAKEYMQVGYERELQYRLNDGSYSAFGQRDGEGSTWLTAFVLKSFAMASEFIEIDSRDLEVTRDWLVNNALDDDTGCFIPRGRIIPNLCRWQLHWTRDDAPPCEGEVDSCKADPAEIEMTSYVLLIYLEASQDDPQFLLDAD
ncbi:Pregnancy zone protein [Apostichopus japonicus]|uniref:Pregnancy zone protein n=1 Tax=Stichopus japonicus TaxID=307972 RepID=A0A2G8LC43_STIJA|nr:Pregnancy zone protein [Apostichopus japonicus]